MVCVHGIPFESTYPGMTCLRCAAIAAGAEEGSMRVPSPLLVIAVLAAGSWLAVILVALLVRGR